MREGGGRREYAKSNEPFRANLQLPRRVGLLSRAFAVRRRCRRVDRVYRATLQLAARSVHPPRVKNFLESKWDRFFKK